MTLTDELKILDEKIKANQAQYDLSREQAKISALSSKELDKYQYLTGEDLGYKPGVVEKVKFEYSPLDEALNKGLKNLIKSMQQTKSINTTIISCIILCIAFINIVCLILKKHHQFTLN